MRCLSGLDAAGECEDCETGLPGSDEPAKRVPERLGDERELSEPLNSETEEEDDDLNNFDFLNLDEIFFARRRDGLEAPLSLKKTAAGIGSIPDAAGASAEAALLSGIVSKSDRGAPPSLLAADGADSNGSTEISKLEPRPSCATSISRFRDTSLDERRNFVSAMTFTLGGRRQSRCGQKVRYDLRGVRK